jgi:hypothetical protein
MEDKLMPKKPSTSSKGQRKVHKVMKEQKAGKLTGAKIPRKKASSEKKS